MSIKVVHCCEDSLAADCSKHLTLRIVEERSGSNPSLAFVDLGGETGWSNRTGVAEAMPTTGRFRRIHPRGLKGDAALAYKCVRAATGQGSALLIAFDSATPDSPLRQGVEAARNTVAQSIPTVVAEATPEFDAWVLMGHEPGQAHEVDALAEVVAALRFDPRERPHALNGTTGNERDAKRVCQRLLGLETQANATAHPRVIDALNAPLQVLLRRGRETGFPEFVGDVEEHLLPLLVP